MKVTSVLRLVVASTLAATSLAQDACPVVVYDAEKDYFPVKPSPSTLEAPRD